MPKKDGLVPLPDHVTAGLLRAIMSIRPRPQSRLILQRLDHDRAANWDRSQDHDVLHRGRVIGRIWRHEYRNHPWADAPPWHWHWRGVTGLPDTEGHAQTLEAAMADYRRAWDAARESGVAQDAYS